MATGEEGLIQLAVNIVSAGVVGIAMLTLLYKTIDGDLKPVTGLVGMFACFFALLLAMRPPHPAAPAIVLIVVVTLLVGFPFAMSTLERIELDQIQVEKLEKAYHALLQRPDNIAARLELAAMLYEHGLPHQAIAIARTTLEPLSTEIDPIHNRSVRDMFRNEEAKLKQWMRLENAKRKQTEPITTCPNCKRRNTLTDFMCANCGAPFLLDLVRATDMRPKIVNRLIICWAVLMLFLVSMATLGLYFQGIAAAVVFAGSVAAVGGFLFWLFKKPDLARAA